MDHKKVRRLKVVKAVGTQAYQLELPPNLKVHPVFHASLMEPYEVSKDPSRQVERLEVEILEGEENWVVRGIVESRSNGRERGRPMEYLVLWEGYPNISISVEHRKH